MKVVIITDLSAEADFSFPDHSGGFQITRLADASGLHLHKDAAAVIHLLFESRPADAILLKEFLPRPVIVNAVTLTLSDIKYPFIRINAWPGFFKGNKLETCCTSETDKTAAEKIFSAMGKKAEWLPDMPGFVSARVVAMIINEAYFALGEKVSTKEEIDTAMKLGTNYPYGPFEWAKKTGLGNILTLLNRLSETEKRYNPSPLLLKEATS